MRDVYDQFLAKFPLFFGYWRKYAEMEFNIAGTEAAEYVCIYPWTSIRTLAKLSGRFTSVVSRAYRILSTYGLLTVLSELRRITTPRSFESK